MLKRKIMKDLQMWKENKKQDCLLVRGVRQCGKTYIIRRFGEENYTNLIEINFIERPDMINAFKDSLDIDTLIQSISLRMPGIRFIPDQTLLFLDEIQECPEARTSLKFWAQDKRFDVICSGSLLGIGYKETGSIPVGYETLITMYPLDFTEFLWAMGISDDMIRDVASYKDGMRKIPDGINSAMLKYFKEYMVIGGMPDVINRYLETHDYYQVHLFQERILRDYQDDIARYADNSDRIKARSCYQSIPRQLTKENHKFQYALVQKKGTARKFERSLGWLREAGMITYAYNVSTPTFPLTAYTKLDNFRIYLSDAGLFCAMFGYQMKQAVLEDTLTGGAKGGIYESVIADILYKRDIPLYFYKKDDSSLEIEFLLERNASVVPVEVKSKRGQSKSLSEVLKYPGITIGYKLTAGNAGNTANCISLPLYMAAFI